LLNPVFISKRKLPLNPNLDVNQNPNPNENARPQLKTQTLDDKP